MYITEDCRLGETHHNDLHVCAAEVIMVAYSLLDRLHTRTSYIGCTGAYELAIACGTMEDNTKERNCKDHCVQLVDPWNMITVLT